MSLPKKEGWIGLHRQHPIKQVGLDVFLTSLFRKIPERKHYSVEKLSNGIASPKFTEQYISWNSILAVQKLSFGQGGIIIKVRIESLRAKKKL